MTIIGLLDWILKRNQDFDILDWDELKSVYKTTHLKQSAVDIVIGKIITMSSLVQFRSKDETLNRKLNVKPNPNQNAQELRAELIKRLLCDGECLVVKLGNDLFIADGWVVDGSVTKERTYKQVSVGQLSLNKEFSSSEVFHFKYHNDKLNQYLKNLDESYAKLFQRMIEVHMREQQIRVYANFKGMKSKSNLNDDAKKNVDVFTKFLAGMKRELEQSSVAVVPRQGDDYDIEEKSQNHLGRNVEEVGVIENMYIAQVAKALQVPTPMFSGDLADVSQHSENMVRWCIKPLMTLIATEINAKFFTESDLNKGKGVKVNLIEVLYSSELQMASHVEKMIGSGVWTIDDALEIQGKPRENTIVTTRRYLTKNIAPLDESTGAPING